MCSFDYRNLKYLSFLFGCNGDTLQNQTICTMCAPSGTLYYCQRVSLTQFITHLLISISPLVGNLHFHHGYLNDHHNIYPPTLSVQPFQQSHKLTSSIRYGLIYLVRHELFSVVLGAYPLFPAYTGQNQRPSHGNLLTWLHAFAITCHTPS